MKRVFSFSNTFQEGSPFYETVCATRIKGAKNAGSAFYIK